MSKEKDISHSILIISSSEQFEVQVKKFLVGFRTIEVRKTEVLARQAVLEQSYDLVALRLPLPDGMGLDLAMDIAENSTSSVMVMVPRELYEEVANELSSYGILVLPFSEESFQLEKTISYMKARQDIIYRLSQKIQKAEEKTEEVRIVSKAKLMLMEEKAMSEDEAHRFIGRMAMNHGISRKKAAEEIMEELE